MTTQNGIESFNAKCAQLQAVAAQYNGSNCSVDRFSAYLVWLGICLAVAVRAGQDHPKAPCYPAFKSLLGAFKVTGLSPDGLLVQYKVSGFEWSLREAARVVIDNFPTLEQANNNEEVRRTSITSIHAVSTVYQWLQIPNPYVNTFKEKLHELESFV